MSYIYLASPYSIDAPANTTAGAKKRQKRYHQALRYAADQSKQGEIIFSPIVHSHPMTMYHDMPGTWDFWSKIDFVFLDQCKKIRVLKLEGWDRSIGVAAELEYAKKIGKEIEYVEHR